MWCKRLVYLMKTARYSALYRQIMWCKRLVYLMKTTRYSALYRQIMWCKRLVYLMKTARYSALCLISTSTSHKYLALGNGLKGSRDESPL